MCGVFVWCVCVCCVCGVFVWCVCAFGVCDVCVQRKCEGLQKHLNRGHSICTGLLSSSANTEHNQWHIAHAKKHWLWIHPTQCVPCSSFLAMWPCSVTSRVSHSLSGGQSEKKTSLMITAFCANFCLYDSAFFLSASVRSSLSTSIGRSRLGSRCCQRKE